MFGRRAAQAHVPTNIDLSTEAGAMRILKKVTEFLKGKCPKENDADAQLFQNGQVMAEAFSQRPGLWSLVNHQANTIARAKAYEAEQARKKAKEAEQKRKEELEAKRKTEIESLESCRAFGDFAKKFKVSKLPLIKDIEVNPFVYKEQIIAICCNFDFMVSENEAVFMADGKPIVISNVPSTEFKDKYYVLVACSVIGTKMTSIFGTSVPVPHLKMEGFTYCKKDCTNLLYWTKVKHTREIGDIEKLCGRIDLKEISNSEKCLEKYGYCVESFKKFGAIDLAYLFFGNYGSHAFFNGLPNEIHCGSEIVNIDLSNHPIVRQFPKADLRDPGDFTSNEDLPNGGQRFIFMHPIVDGCRACEVIGEANVGFEFDSQGRFGGAKIMGITTTEEIAKNMIQQIKNSLESRKFSEADQKMTDLQNKIPNLDRYLSSDWKLRGVFAECRRQLTIKFGRVKDVIGKDTFTLDGTVTAKRIVANSVAFNKEGFIELGFEFEKGFKLDCLCHYEDYIPYLLIDDVVVGDEEGLQQLSDVYPRARFIFTDDAKGWVDNVRGNSPNEGDGICPIAIAMYSSRPPIPTTQKQGPKIAETYSLEKLVGSAALGSRAVLFSDSELRLKADGVQPCTSVEVMGFVRAEDNSILALQAKGSSAANPFYVSLEDVVNFKQTNEDGAYLEILLASAVFNKNGRTSCKETMKTLDAYLNSYPQARFAPNAMLDYLLCLEWLFLNDKSVNKEAILRLAEMYVEKAKQRFLDAPQTKKCELVVLGMKNSSADKHSKRAGSSEYKSTVEAKTEAAGAMRPSNTVNQNGKPKPLYYWFDMKYNAKENSLQLVENKPPYTSSHDYNCNESWQPISESQYYAKVVSSISTNITKIFADGTDKFYLGKWRLILFWDGPKGGGSREVDEGVIRVCVPYFPDGKRINIYDAKSNEMALSIDVSSLSM
jgi:hypothetical protein